MLLDGRQLFVNAYVEDPDGLVLVVFNPKERFWSLPGCQVRAGEAPASACARTLQSECGVHPTQLFEMIAADAGETAHVIVLHTIIDHAPRTMRAEAPVAAMTHEEYLAQTPFPAFYGKVFDRARARRLFCVVAERYSARTRAWDLEKHHLHALDVAQARRDFVIGESQDIGAGKLRIVACALAIGYRVENSNGTLLSA